MKYKTRCSEIDASPLDLVMTDFARRLAELGYTRSTANQYVAIGQKFEKYLGRRKISPAAISESHLEAFLKTTSHRKMRPCGLQTRQFWRRALRMLLELIPRAGQASFANPPMKDPATARLDEYLTFLRGHRGFKERTMYMHRLYAGRFLSHLRASTDEHLRSISVAQVDGFLIDSSRTMARRSIGMVCAPVRGFLRYLHMRGLLARNLTPQVMTPRLYTQETLPRSIDWPYVERVFAEVDRTTAKGCRDYAILILLAHCGLRACEVAGLRISDIDWRRDAIHLRRPKIGTNENVPLVSSVGEALVAYIRQRPSLPVYAEVFLTVQAPIRPLVASGVSMCARHYLLGAGIKAPRLGSHTFRHSYAVHLLRQGFPLKTIGDALGHHNPQSTFIYTKAAVEDLRTVGLKVGGVLP